MKILRNLLWPLVYALPAVLFFSYHPVIGLGANSSMNFELSLPLLWLIIFDFFSFITMVVLFVQKRQSAQHKSTSKSIGQASARSKHHSGPWGPHLPGLTDRRFFLLAIFPLYLTISVFWSANPLRGLFTAGVMWAVFFAVFSLLFIVPQTGAPRRLRTHVLLTMFISAVIVCKFCYAQSIMDTCFGLSRDATLLCPGCTYRSFGFPHPSGFAIEPQFMGNLLLAPTLTALYLVAFRSRKFANTVIHEASHLENEAEHNLLHDQVHLPEVNWKLWQRIGMIILAGFLSMTLFFTFSRGAIYAYVVAILSMLIFALKRHQFRWSLIAIPVVSFILSLSLQGTFAAVGPTAETFFSGVAKSVHQLSLGLIDFRSLAYEPSEDAIEQYSYEHAVPTSVAREILKRQYQSQLSSQSVKNSSSNGGKPVDKTSLDVEKNDQNVDKIDQDVEKTAEIIDHEITKEETKLENEVDTTLEDIIFEGYVPESTNIRLHLNRAAIDTWLSAPGHPESGLSIGLKCSHSDPCLASGKLTPTSILFGVGLGGAGTALYLNSPVTDINSPKEIVQNEPFSLLLETGLVGIALAIFGLLIIFAPQIFTRKFLDGKSAPATKSTPSPFWRHPALPLLLSLIVAYVITLNFFSGLPNALQIYLMPPLLYLIFSDHYRVTTV